MVRRAVERSTRRTINHMGNWLGENSGHELYDISTRYFVEYAARLDPDAATQWAAEIGDERLRAEAEQILGR
jgi:hypothetical protein